MKASIFNLFFLVAIIFMISKAPVSAQGNSIITDLDQTFYIPCANGGEGELVNFTGSFHTVINVNEDGNGGYHYHGHFQPQGAKGVGLTTGDEYVGTGVGKTSFNGTGNGTINGTYVTSFKLIGKGQNPSLRIQTVAHFTVNANGIITVYFDLENEACN